jgi:integrase
MIYPSLPETIWVRVRPSTSEISYFDEVRFEVATHELPAFDARKYATFPKPIKRVDEAVVRYLNAEEARRLVNACGKDSRKLVQAALLTGCRCAEFTRLDCGDFNPDVIRLSKGKVRHVVLTDEAKAAFDGWTTDRCQATRSS